MWVSGLLLATVLSGGATAPPSTRYDQRQEGTFNIHAQLDNVLVILVPGAGGGGGGLNLGELVGAGGLLFRGGAKRPPTEGLPSGPGPTPPPEFESPQGEKTEALLAALAAEKIDAEEPLNETTLKPESQPVTLQNTTLPPPTSTT